MPCDCKRKTIQFPSEEQHTNSRNSYDLSQAFLKCTAHSYFKVNWIAILGGFLVKQMHSYLESGFCRLMYGPLYVYGRPFTHSGVHTNGGEIASAQLRCSARHDAIDADIWVD